MVNITDLSDSELKTTLGRLFEENDSVDDIYQILKDDVTNKRIWNTLITHLCMERIYKPQPFQENRISFRIAQVVDKFGQEKVRQAFMELLKYVSENFSGSFDELYQKVSAVVDFGCFIDPDTFQEDDVSLLAPFIPILNIDESTSDPFSHRLAMKFAAFLTKLCFKDGQNILKMDYEAEKTDDLVSQLFENLKMKKKLEKSGENDEKSGFSLDAEELELLNQKEGPETLKDYCNFWTERENWKKTFMALKLFPKFAKSNRNAIKAQSHQLIKTLYIIENTNHIKGFNTMVTENLVQVIYSDLSAIPDLLAKLDFQKVVSKKIQIILVLNDVMDRILHTDEKIPGKIVRPKQKTIGTVVRKSITLQQQKTTVRPTICTVRWILVPFFGQIQKLDLAKMDPNFAAAIINFIQNSVDWRPTGLVKVVQ
ncbi:unnamed protein product [Bursaphelenchus xylophilus]|uniref:(pine wood nematode) hypothetical protein n=1 Tax=Bursaphelenchus xylophilus TaxID=6326 RepID=A0A7I8XM67_BURXY|nr:unnamed protein product [Bursaphelenchus xylophilus]CAG9089893.1 unnamed protein product [Bursaphelenchus xylophilus]